MTRRELINMTKTKVDEISPPDGAVSLISLSHDKPIDSFADNLLDECAKEVLMLAPAMMLRGQAGGNNGIAEKGGSGYVVLPPDFLRLLEFKMAGWKCPVTDVAPQGSSLALKQGNPYLRGGACKPVCVFAHRPEGRVIEYHSVKKKHDIERFIYVPVMPAEDIPVDLQDVLTWWCASRIFQITGKSNEAQMAYERGKNLL